MGRRVTIVERSPLARNIYMMILSQLDEIELISEEAGESISKIEKSIGKSSLVVMSQSTIGDRKKEFFKMIRAIEKELKVPCIIFVNKGKMSEWKEFAGLDNVEIIERPFSPDDLLNMLKRQWGIK